MSGTSKFWDKAAESYAKSKISDMEGYTHTLERTRSYLGAQETVLEIGCGTGATALELAQDTQSYLGTDVSRGMIDIARRNAGRAAIAQLRFDVAGTLEALQACPPVTRVLAFNVLHLLKDIPATLRAAHHALEPGGLLITKTSCLRSAKLPLRVIVALILPLMRLVGKAPYVKSLTKSELDLMIEAAGFQIVETVGSAKDPSRHYVVARRIERG